MSDITVNHKFKNSWEIPEVDLNLRHYSGSVSDVFKKIKHDIVSYLMSPAATDASKKIYSAIYNALDYYEVLSPEFSGNNDFLDSAIQTFNEDLDYLSGKYNTPEAQVISLNARIKSPLSFVEKVKDKVNEYISENRNFVYFNESLRDILGVRVVVNPPPHIKSQGLQAESDYLYDVFYSLMTSRGILENPEISDDSKFKFLDVNTRYDTNKLEKMKKNKYPGKFILTSDTPTFKDTRRLEKYECIVKPTTRPAFIDEIDSKVKDYHFYPKKSGYQSLHICIVPKFSKNVQKMDLPNCIIPSATSDYSIEYQFRDSREDDFSNFGPASHGKLKPFEKIYHRLAIPSFIDTDETIPIMTSKRALKPRTFGENYQRFYGPTFENRFNINYQMFSYTFDEATQDDILAGVKVVNFDEHTNTYNAVPNPIPLCVERNDRQTLEDPNTMASALEEVHVSDSSLVPRKTDSTSSRKKNKICLYKLVSSKTKSKDNRVLSKKLKVSSRKNKSEGPGLDDDL